jgi:hypothetical protein
MFKKKAQDLLRSIKSDNKEFKKGSAINEVLTLKSNEALAKESIASNNKGGIEIAEKQNTLDELMGNLVIKRQVKFAEGQSLKSPFGEEVKRALKPEKVFKGTSKYNPQWTEDGKKIAEKVFSCDSKQYFITLQQLSQPLQHKK